MFFLAKRFVQLILGICIFMQYSCVSSNNSDKNFPKKADFPGYVLIDAKNQKVVNSSVKKNAKIAIVVKNLAVTAYYNLQKPRYDKDFVLFEGTSPCCAPTEQMFGSAGLLVYQFQVLKKSGNTEIELIARHKGLDPQQEYFDSDDITRIKLKIN